jgi:hypothetical protein
MKIYLTTLAISLILLYLADTTITWRPFSISFGRGWLVLGMILIAVGVGMVYYQGRWDGLKRGGAIKEEVKKEIEESKIKETI